MVRIRETLWKFGAVRRFWLVLERVPPFVAAAFSARDGLLSARGRTLIRGKIRRSFLSLCPPLARALQQKHGLAGGCSSCGASCNLLFQCPHWDARSRLCSVYEDRPAVCRLFPITPSDIRDRDLVAPGLRCGFSFRSSRGKKPVLAGVAFQRTRQSVDLNARAGEGRRS